MSLLPAARRYAAKLQSSPEKVILDFLIANAVGRSTAKPWGVIKQHLISQGFQCEKTEFQQGILKLSRGSDFFIGSYDHSPFRGFFIIDTQQDAELVRDWYVNRMNSLQDNLNNLRNQCTNVGWKI
jgi:hypothetical protein